VVSGSDALVIDPSEAGPIAKEISRRNLNLASIVVTHEHIDHIAGVRALQKRFGVTVYLPKGASIPGKTVQITDGYTLKLRTLSLRAIFVPGHHSFPYPVSTLNNNIAWYRREAGILFTGDTLFSCGYGYTARGHENAMFESLKLLRSYPDDTRIFSGHEYAMRLTESARGIDPENRALRERLREVRGLIALHKPTVPTTLGLEKAINPWLRWDDEKVKKGLELIGALFP